ncbi:MAG: class I adenylate-forming enzyme family protein [Pseudomonadota bacterium]
MSGMSFEDAVAHLLANEPAFATSTADIRGTSYRVFANAPRTLRELLQSARSRHDDGRADFIVYGSERWSFDAYCADVCAVAESLRARGIKRGDRVAIAMRNYPELLILFLAIVSVGGVVVFLNAWWTEPELEYALSDSQPKLICADGPRMTCMLPLKDRLGLNLVGVRDGEALGPEAFSKLKSDGYGASWPDVEIDADDDFGIMYSSGTTGHPKGVVLTHRGAVNAVHSFMMSGVINRLRSGADAASKRIVLVVTPLFHVTATHPVFLTGMAAGDRLVLMHKWDTDEALELIKTEGVTALIGVPTQSADLMEAAKSKGEPLETLSFIVAGGAKRPAAQVGQLAQVFPKAAVATGWGMTETNAIGITMSGAEYLSRPDACGRLAPPVQDLRFLDPGGQDVPPGTLGELTVKSPCNMRCYINKPEATAEVLEDGWLRTGDLGYIDGEGFVTIVDRAKNIIIRGGENIACLDVESALHQHGDVLEACAFPLPHARLGEMVGALVQLRPGSEITTDMLQAFLGDHIARFKIPERIWLQADPLPRGATDKLDRRGIRALCTDRLTREGAENAAHV